MKLFEIVKAAATDFIDDECMTSGAALAYYTIFSLPPLLAVVFFLAGMFGVSDEKIDEVVRGQIGLPTAAETSSQGGDDAGEEASGVSMGTLADRSRSGTDVSERLGPLSKLIGVLLLLLSATAVFAQLQHALNRAWEVEPDPEKGGVRVFLVKRGLSLGMIVVFAFLLLVSLVLTTLVEQIGRWIEGETPGLAVKMMIMAMDNAITLAMATVLFAAVFQVLPDADMLWKDTWVGAFLTAVLFVIGKTLLGLYLQRSDVAGGWGSAAGSLIASLVWVYYTSLIVLFGAELTQAWAKRYGAGVKPCENAVRISEERHVIREEGDQGSVPTS